MPNFETSCECQMPDFMRHPAKRNNRKNPQISCTLNLPAKIWKKKVFQRNQKKSKVES